MMKRNVEMKKATTIVMALALVTGLSATALSVESADARGWGNEQGERWHGKRGKKGMRGMRGPMKMMQEFDTNEDKALTKEELTAGLDKKIADNDKDGDAAVSLEEFKAEWMKLTEDRMVRAFQRMDRDGSGKVTAEELKEPALMMFERMDANDDGKLDNADRSERRKGRWGKWGGRFMQQDQAPAEAPKTDS